MFWFVALTALLAVGVVWATGDHRRAKRARKCPCCGSRDLAKARRTSWLRDSRGMHWTCTQCQVALFEPESVSFPRDFPGPMTAEQYKTYCDGIEIPAARVVRR